MLKDVLESKKLKHFVIYIQFADTVTILRHKSFNATF